MYRRFSKFFLELSHYVYFFSRVVSVYSSMFKDDRICLKFSLLCLSLSMCLRSCIFFLKDVSHCPTMSQMHWIVPCHRNIPYSFLVCLTILCLVDPKLSQNGFLLLHIFCKFVSDGFRLSKIFPIL